MAPGTEPLTRLKNERDQVRRLFTRTLNSLETNLQNNETSKAIVDYAFLEGKMTRLCNLDHTIQEIMLDAYEEQSYSREIDEAEYLKYKYIEVKHIMDELVSTKLKKDSDKKPTTSRSNLNYPKLELKKFDDNPKNWLSFWGQFKKIHEAEDLEIEDKFQYLLQSLQEGSSAKSLVESFPTSAENYSKAVTQLKERFARDDVLIQVYIREIIQLILNQSQAQLNIVVLYNRLSSYLHCLESLGVTKVKYETILYPLVESALPDSVLIAWNRCQKPKQLVPLLEFFKQEIESEECIKMARSNNVNSTATSSDSIKVRPTDSQSRTPTAACIVSNVRPQKIGKDTNITCCLCNKNNHVIFQCSKASDMTLEQKKEAIKESGCCYICLRKGHMANKCKAFVKCISCHKRHNIILCPQIHSKENITCLSHKTNETLLQTLVVNITSNGAVKKVRALIDNGSQRSYVKSSVVKALKLQEAGKVSIGHTVFGGESKPTKVHKCFELQVSAINNSFETQIIALEQAQLCGHLPKLKDQNIIKKLKDLNMDISDINYTDNEVGLLIGSDYLGSIMTNNMVSFNDNLMGIETKLGWTIQGPTSQVSSTISNTSLCVSKMQLNDVSNLWNVELLGIQDPFEKQNKEVARLEMLNLFNDNISVNESGRYEVSLLWKDGCPEPGTNYDVARKRLDSTTKKLITTGNLHTYNEIFQDWEKEGIIQKVDNEDFVTGHYLPHHAVVKLSSTTTRVRPVFDASARGQSRSSLNDCLNKGINLIELIPRLLILFRKGAHGVTADIAKAFLQLSICERDRNFLKFLWWKNPDRCDEIITYQHNRVVFGINCSPFLLTATINYHLENCCHEYKDTAQKLKQLFYVDNCIASFDTLDQLNVFISQSKEIMAKAKFDLRGWITTPERTETTLEVPVLGMTWNTKDDVIYCNIPKKTSTVDKITKRYLLSVTQQLFDPLGLLCPVTLVPKHILQKVWEKKYDWDTEIPTELAQEFQQWQKQLYFLDSCKVPRRLTAAPLEDCETTLHTYCDGSEKAFSAFVFLRTQKNNRVHVQLVLAKSRIAPANKTMSLPRLELMGAVIASRLYKEVIDSGLLKQCKNYKEYFWTDSAVVLAWIKRSRSWKPFVSNRIKEICQTTNADNWYHLPGELNPADLPSRGCNAKKLLSSRWWEGPAWLKSTEKEWPMSKLSEVTVNEDMVKQEQKLELSVNLDVSTPPFSARLMYFSKYNRIVRLVAWILRMSPKFRKQFQVSDHITNDEYLYAEKALFKLLQKEHLSEGTLPKNLNTELDEEGIRRVKTRLELSHECKEFVCPILLPGKNEIVQRLVRQTHEKLKHAGTTLLMSNLRNEFWILNIRRLAKNTVSRCLICKRFKAKHYEVPEAPLPTDRVENVTAFQTTGIDFAGPLILRDQSKCWIALYTCATYRAVHLELVESLSTNSFMMSLRRFIARRGRVNTIYTDHGTNFLGAANQLKGIDWNEIQADTSIELQKIKWKFIPPASPWWGGWWERMVRVIKEMLRRVLGKASVTWIELSTILCEIEAVVNSRPLTYVTTDDDALRPLTPMMFLHGISTAETPDLDNIDKNNINMRLRYLEKLRSDFRQRFKKEYLSLLVSRNHCKSYVPNVGDVVLVEVESSRLHWPLGIIKELVSGSDGRERVVRVKTATGEKTRACQRLYPLELSAATDEWRNSTADDGKPERLDLRSRASCDLTPDVPHRLDDTSQPQVSNESQPFTAATRLGRVVKIPRRFLD